MTLNARQIEFRAHTQSNQLDHIQYLSAPVGSGKTEAVISDIRSRIQTHSFIFVSPTILLAQEVKTRLDIALVNHGQGENVHLIATDTTEPLSVLQRVRNHIIGKRPNSQHVLIVTTETFRNMLPTLSDEQKSQYDVYLDEGIEAVDYAELRTQTQNVFMDAIEVSEDHSFSVGRGQRELLEAVARNPARLAAMEREELAVSGYQDIAKLLVSDIYDVYGEVSDGAVRVVAFLRPDQFLAFRSITIIMAIFEQSLLALFWREKYGIRFRRYDTDHELFDTHQNKGSLISIYHALHPGDTASGLNLKRNARTGEENASGVSQERVIDQIAISVANHFNDRPYCWAANNYFANAPRILSEPRMPTKCAGMDEYRRHDIVASLACMNPRPWVKTIITQHVAITDRELYELWKLSHTYQTIGRCSLRDRSSERPIEIVVISEDCAQRIHQLFVGSQIVGQITDLPSYEGMRRRRGPAQNPTPYTRADNTAWSRYRNSHPETELTKEDWYENIRNN